jgi:hypothetical protein
MDERVKPSVEPLESELAGFPPAALSAKLVRTIGQELSRHRRSHARRNKLIGFAIVGLAAAACVVVALAPWRDSTSNPVVVVITPRQNKAPDAAPTWASYQQAFDRSPETFDAILDRDSGRLLRFAGDKNAVSADHVPELDGDRL